MNTKGALTKFSSLAPLAVMGLCACGSGGQSSTVQVVPPPPRTVTGTQVVSYVSETGSVDVPDDLSKTTITAYVPSGSGGYTATAGSGTADGHFSIQNIPAGFYLLLIGSSYFWTSATNIDTGSQVQGRANPTPATSGEKINFDVTLTQPTQSTDQFELVDPNLPAEYFSYLPINTPPSNTYSQVFFWPSALIDASQGDKAYLVRVTATSGFANAGPHQTQYYAKVQDEMTPALLIQMVPGVMTDVTSSMTQGPAQTFRANFKLSAFAALNSQMAVGQDITPGTLGAGASAAPPFAVVGGSSGSLGVPGYRLDTLANFSIFPPDTSVYDVDLGDFAYRNGFPADYKTLVFADWAIANEYSPSGAFPASLKADLVMDSLTLPTATQPIAPVLGPVQALRLDGADVFNNQLNGVSLTPTITWQPPAIGVANFYQVDVVQLTIGTCIACAHPQFTVTTNVATFQTQQTSLTLPSGVLSPGSTYVLVVTAKNAVGVNLDSMPLRTTYPSASADALSQMFTTAGTPTASAVPPQGSYGPLLRNRKNTSRKNSEFGLP